ncbi:hypothetical protein A4G19_04230 [Pasteurellaceae bacterium Macca]|nr:hypothetical protein [Pasteurellaceae bacterium Macca]
MNTFRQSSFDIIALRFSVFMIFFVFGTTKWFEFEVQALKPLISSSWLSFLYDLFGYYGASYFLGVIEAIAYIGLFVGFWRPKAGIIGTLIVMGTAVVTLSTTFQLGFNGFIFKDILLLGAGFVLLKNDLNRLYAQK